MSLKRLVACVSIALLTTAGCSESTRIQTSPQGARVYVDNVLVGVSPTVYSVSRAEFSQPHVCRAELDGYAPAEEPLRKTLAVGRLIGAIFTLGIVYAFRSPYAFRNTHELVLEKLPDAPQSAGSSPVRPGGPTTEERLHRIKQLRQQGVITQEEFDKYELEILRAK